MWLQMKALVNIFILVGSTLAQSYQYSTGWTNGAQGKNSIVYDECMVMRTKAQLGFPLPKEYFTMCKRARPVKTEFEEYLLDQNRFLLPNF